MWCVVWVCGGCCGGVEWSVRRLCGLWCEVCLLRSLCVVCCVLCVVCGLFNACAFCLKPKPKTPGGCVGINNPSYLVTHRHIYRHA